MNAAILIVALATTHTLAGGSDDAIAVAGRIAQQPEGALWPGFDPAGVPLMIYDGARTVLINHPEPPGEFLRNAEGVGVFDGRHDAVVANTTVEIAGAWTAVASIEGLSLDRAASLLIHEAFHAHQRRSLPGWWTVNEVELLTYPFDDAENLALRRLETEALRRALQTERLGDMRVWASEVLAIRRQRFARLSEGASTYERGVERLEGVPRFVQWRFERAEASLPEAGFEPEEVRARAYETGAAFAALLDRLDPTWVDLVNRGDGVWLDQALAQVLGWSGGPSERFRPEEVAAQRERALSEVASLRREWDDDRRRVLGAPGLSIEVVVDAGAPLWPAEFDPLNVRRVSNAEVIHRRWLRLSGDAGSLEVLGHPMVSTGVGPHPLFNGVRAIVVTGLDRFPDVNEAGDGVEITGAGVSIRLAPASVEREGDRLVVRVARR